MAEMFSNAWTGWFRVTEEGKIMALFLVSLLFLWIGGRQEKQKALLRYGTFSALCCIFPVTAAMLMLYQTRFYHYEWIWSMVPVTILTAYAGTRVLAECWQGFRREAWRRGLPLTAGLLAVAFLCCGQSGPGAARADERAWGERTERILETVGPDMEGSQVCMWAPRKIMEYVRRLDGSILLPYGRSMWEGDLGGYSLDTYSREMEQLYHWMSLAEETCMEDGFDTTEMVRERMEEQMLSTEACLEIAEQAGVNLLVLPENVNRILLDEVTCFTGVSPRQVSGYFYFRL